MTVALRQEAEQPNNARAKARERARAILVGYCGVIGSLTDAQLAEIAGMPAGETQEIGRHPNSR